MGGVQRSTIVLISRLVDEDVDGVVVPGRLWLLCFHVCFFGFRRGVRLYRYYLRRDRVRLFFPPVVWRIHKSSLETDESGV